MLNTPSIAPFGSFFPRTSPFKLSWWLYFLFLSSVSLLLFQAPQACGCISTAPGWSVQGRAALRLVPSGFLCTVRSPGKSRGRSQPRGCTQTITLALPGIAASTNEGASFQSTNMLRRCHQILRPSFPLTCLSSSPTTAPSPPSLLLGFLRLQPGPGTVLQRLVSAARRGTRMPSGGTVCPAQKSLALTRQNHTMRLLRGTRP